MSEEKTYIILLEEAKQQRDEEIQRLNYKLQQKENIIKEAKKETSKQLKRAITQEYTDLRKILNILDKGE